MGRLPQQDSSSYNPEKLWDVHKEVVRRIVLGQSNVDIARELNVTPQMVSYTRNSSLGKQEVERLSAMRDNHTVDVAAHIKEMAPKALKVLEDILDNDEAPMRVRSSVAQDLLDRAGHGAPTKIQGAYAHMHFTREDIDDIKQTAIAEVRQKMAARDVTATVQTGV